MACVADDPEDRVDLVILDPEDDRRVRLLQESARAVQAWTIATTSFTPGV